MKKTFLTRRNFIVAGVLAWIGVSTSKFLKSDQEEQQDRVLLLSKDGKLYETNHKALRKTTRRTLESNEDLRKWSNTKPLEN